MSARQLEFKDFITLQRGFDLPKSQMKEGEVPVLGSNCIIGSHNEAKVEPPGVVTGRSGTLGLVQYTEIPYWPHNTALWVKDFKGNSPKFVYYKLQTMHLENFNGGASVPTLNRNALDTLPVSIPDHDTQHRIADILSTYDDLIENNRRRIALLEQAARLLYREWFVHLRFPSHEHFKIIDGVPDGWEKKRLDKVAIVNRASLGKGYQGEIEYIDISSVTPGSIDETTIYRFEDAPSRARRIVQHGDIIWSCVRPNRKSHAVIWRPPENLIASTGFAVITPTELPTSYLYHTLITDEYVGYLVNNARGVAYPAVTATVFEKSMILVPAHHLLRQFDEFVEPNLEQAHILRYKLRRLAQARDLFLPRLMNGEIAV